MSVTLPVSKSIKVGETLEITPVIVPDELGAIYQWMKNGTNVVGARSREKILILENAQKVDSGLYTLAVTVDSTPTVSTPCVVTVLDDTSPPDPKPPIDLEYYIHDLNPARDHGFTWIGWWVLDELQKAVNENFDWKTNPTDERFKYPHVIKAIADGLDHWDDIEMQESRNGYILSAKSFVIK